MSAGQRLMQSVIACQCIPAAIIQLNCCRIGDITMTTTVTEKTDRGRAVLVEQCNCPPEYTGTSCEVRHELSLSI